MKVAILAGGKGSRLAEMTDDKPKGLVELGNRPILWHIMKIYSHYGFDDFVIAVGHRGQQIVDFIFDSGLARTATHVRSDGSHREAPPGDGGEWTVTLVDTGPDSPTGERLKRLRPYLDHETFMLTWCDGLADIEVNALLRFHRRHGRAATVTATHPPPRFGRMVLDGDAVVEFQEDAVLENEWINGAFFVLEPSVFDYIKEEPAAIEHDLLPALAGDGQLMAFRHASFWHCMDTVSEQRALDAMWSGGAAPWKVWAN
ncbi:MAG: NTP transferase domain-containing protein [Alphaproteobacteria bacterium]|nr:NTP transferase domain-containing protein [Alphaproteobacteria bacterium]